MKDKERDDSHPKVTVIQGLTKDQLINAMNACNYVRDNYKPLHNRKDRDLINKILNIHVKPTHDELNEKGEPKPA